MWNIDGTGAGDGVDPQKVQHKYVSGAAAWDEVNPLKNWPHFGTHIVV